jgi:hypothetical protein
MQGEFELNNPGYYINGIQSHTVDYPITSHKDLISATLDIPSHLLAYNVFSTDGNEPNMPKPGGPDYCETRDLR